MKELQVDRKIAQSLRKNQTKEENHLWYDFLKTYPVQFKRQYQVGPYYVDFYCYRAQLVIELDGSQHYEAEGMTRDMQRTAYLNDQGLKVLRFANTDIWGDFAGVCETIDAEVRKRLG